MTPRTPSQVPPAARAYLAGIGSATTEPSLYQAVISQDDEIKALRAGFKSVKSYQKWKYEDDCKYLEGLR